MRGKIPAPDMSKAPTFWEGPFVASYPVALYSVRLPSGCTPSIIIIGATRMRLRTSCALVFTIALVPMCLQLL